MHLAKAPPAPQPVELLGLSCSDAFGEAGVRGFKMRLEQRQNARHGGQHGDALGCGSSRSCAARPGGSQNAPRRGEWRNPEAHGLAEDVAQRQRVQNAQRMNEPLIAHVWLGAVFDWADAGQHVAVREHDAFGIAGGAGGEENLQRRVVGQRRNGPRLGAGSSACQSSKARVGKWAVGDAVAIVAASAAATLARSCESPTASLGFDIGGNASGKFTGAIASRAERPARRATCSRRMRRSIRRCSRPR